MLPDQQLAAGIRHLELHRKRAGLLVDHAGVVHMFRFEGHRIRTTGNLQRQLGDAAGRRGVSGRNLRA